MDFPVRGIGGAPQAVANFLFGRLREIEVHHVDLDAGYGPSDWPKEFVREALNGVPARLSPGVEEPFVAVATDLDVSIAIGNGQPVVRASGPGHDLLHWLLGRGSGRMLESTAGSLPDLPPWG